MLARLGGIHATSRPAESLCPFGVATVEVLRGVRTLLFLIRKRVVATAQIERIDAELTGQRVHRALECECALGVSGCTERVHRARIQKYARLARVHVRALIELVKDLCRTREPSAVAIGDRGVALDGHERSVAAGTDR